MDEDFFDALERKLASVNGEYSSNSRYRPYDGQPWTDLGVRGSTEITGITFRDLTDCICAAFLICSGQPALQELVPDIASPEIGGWNRGDVYSVDTGNIDPIALSQTVSCLVEKYMGIFPNVDKLSFPEEGTENVIMQYLEDNNYSLTCLNNEKEQKDDQ
jgi:hypothetical protein